MNLQPQTLYHIYNQGNNRQDVFLEPSHFLLFLRKMRRHLLPFGDVLGYCLMPNHFHWLFHVRQLEAELPCSRYPKIKYQESLNDSIGVLLRSYTRAVNNQYGRSGSLFRQTTKAKDGWPEHWVALPPNATKQPQEYWNEYGLGCLNYIHENPVRAGLVKQARDWPYSSYQDYAGLRRGTLCNKALANELLNLSPYPVCW